MGRCIKKTKGSGVVDVVTRKEKSKSSSRLVEENKGCRSRKNEEKGVSDGETIDQDRNDIEGTLV